MQLGMQCLSIAINLGNTYPTFITYHFISLKLYKTIVTENTTGTYRAEVFLSSFRPSPFNYHVTIIDYV